ncbi:relaxation protein [Lysobacter sp. CA199]|uniref:relaxation protein n=1 Tax=Lysobacter sp. CA199 TaxID=3455608 RepID=UPI003F8D8D4F
MDQQELTELISATATLMEQFERNCAQIEQQQRALSQQLQTLSQQLPATVRQSADATLSGLPGELMGKLRSGLERPVGDYEKRLVQAGTALGDGSQALAQQLQRMERMHKSLIWKVTGTVIACIALLLVGAIWLSMHYIGVIRDNQVAADKLKAINSADLILCGDRLCANIDRKAQGYGDKGQYAPVQRR